MAAARPRQRPPRSARRAGYLIGALLNGALLWLVNVSPGWQAVPFLTQEFDGVLPLSMALARGGRWRRDSGAWVHG